jgi:hypothetical protein
MSIETDVEEVVVDGCRCQLQICGKVKEFLVDIERAKLDEVSEHTQISWKGW